MSLKALKIASRGIRRRVIFDPPERLPETPGHYPVFPPMPVQLLGSTSAYIPGPEIAAILG